MTTAIKNGLTNGMHGLQNNIQAATNWLGKHKVTASGAALAAASVATVIGVSILTNRATAIICGAILGSGALISGLGTIAFGDKHHITEKKAEDKMSQQAAIDNSYERGWWHGTLGSWAVSLASVGVVIASRRLF
jgi:hypothetical protein